MSDFKMAHKIIKDFKKPKKFLREARALAHRNSSVKGSKRK